MKKDPALEKISSRMPELIDRMFELADGVKVLDDETGTMYSRPPERAAIEYLLNRVLGRPGPAKGEPDRIAFEGSVNIVLPDNFRDPEGGSVGNSSSARASDAVPFDAC